MWEDERNVEGGRWVIQCEKKMSGVPLGRLVLGVIGEQFYQSEKLVCISLIFIFYYYYFCSLLLMVISL